jgi:hypothetical protein
MIKLERTSVMNMDNAIRGARNPMNSWDKSDSYSTISYEDGLEYEDCLPKFILGPNDLTLARKLVKAGSDHRKFLRQIFVSVDITAPLYWWKEMDTYKVATVANSCSTMHKIHAKEFTLDDFSHEHLSDVSIAKYPMNTTPFSMLLDIIDMLNICRDMFLETKDKQYWWQMIQLLPSSYNQLRTVTLSYETLLNIYHARKNHKLDEWHTVCDWIETLPYFKEMCLEGEVDGN